ncbi:contact-dependent growth inhibition system immunity protein [Chitinophagaceae bacterium MMS25-I14]
MQKTLEQLENSYWNDTDFPSNLVRRCHEYRKIPVDQLTTEQLRLLIGQNKGVQYIMPFALRQLEENILISGDFYEGDLLKAVLSVDKNYWQSNPGALQQLTTLLKMRLPEIEKADTEDEHKHLLNTIKHFREQHMS